MANKYPLTIEEKFYLIEQILGYDINMENVFVSSKNDNKFYMQILDTISSYIKFNDYDADIKLELPNPEEYSNPTAQRIFFEQQGRFFGRARQLRRVLRQYKEEKFGEPYIRDCKRYYEIKDKLFTQMQENNRNISKLTKEITSYQRKIESYQRKNDKLNPIISDIEKIEEYAEEFESQ